MIHLNLQMDYNHPRFQIRPILLPNLQLLRQILRAHRTKLPPNMRSLGDQYVRKEFADMRDVTKPEVLERFRGEWEKYLQQLETAPADDLGADLDAEILGTMSDDQKAKLVDMRSSSRKLREDEA